MLILLQFLQRIINFYNIQPRIGWFLKGPFSANAISSPFSIALPRFKYSPSFNATYENRYTDYKNKIYCLRNNGTLQKIILTWSRMFRDTKRRTNKKTNRSKSRLSYMKHSLSMQQTWKWQIQTHIWNNRCQCKKLKVTNSDFICDNPDLHVSKSLSIQKTIKW